MITHLKVCSSFLLPEEYVRGRSILGGRVVHRRGRGPVYSSSEDTDEIHSHRRAAITAGWSIVCSCSGSYIAATVAHELVT